MSVNNMENITHRIRFNSNSAEKQLIKNNTFIEDTSKKSILNYKIDQELKSLPEDFGNILKRGLSKHVLTSEVYIPKNISLDKNYNKDLLIEKIKNYDKFIFDRHKIAEKLATDNSSFSKVYNYIKELDGKNNRQRQYFDELENLYLSKDYNLKNCGIKKGENIFDYSMLIDKTFGDNIKQDAIRLINEIDNKDLLKEHKLVFKLNNELIDNRLKNKTNNISKRMLKKMMNKDEYLKLLNNRKSIKFVTKNNYKNKNNKSTKNNKVVLKKIKLKKLKKGNSYDKVISTEDNYIDSQLKNNIKRIEDNLENIKNSLQTETDETTKIMISPYLRKSIFDNIDKIEDIKKTTTSNNLSTDNNFKKINLIKIRNQNNSEIKLSTTNSNSNSNLDLSEKTNDNKITEIKNYKAKNTKKTKNKLPLINNKSYEELANLNLSSSTTTNCSIDKIKKRKTNVSTPKGKNKKDYINIFNLTDDLNDKKKQMLFKRKSQAFTKLKYLKLIKERQKRNEEILSFLKLFLIKEGDKKLINKNELNYHFYKFQEKNNELFETFRNKKLKESNLHGFVSNFQRVAGGKNFGNLSEKNKYLKRNNYNNLISNFYDNNDEFDAMSVKDIDNKISNLYYNLADLILNNHLIHK